MSLAGVMRRPRMRSALPTGTVTFLLTDVEASSASWAADPESADRQLELLEALIAGCVDRNGGSLLKSRGEGDSSFAVFDRPSSAIVAAYEIQVGLSEGGVLRVRAAVHTGEARLRDGDYFGVVPNRAARLRSIAHGGQVVVSQVSAELAETELAEPISLVRLGSFRIRDWPRTTQVFGVRGPGIRTDFPPLRVLGDRHHAVMTVVVTDMIGSTEMVAGLTDLEVFESQRVLDVNLRRALADHEGTFLKMMGDGCLAAFDDPISAVGFARELASDATMRCAIGAGRVELVGDDIVGRVIYEASHLCGRAEGGQILVTPTGAELLKGTGTGLQMIDADGVAAVRT
jgi:class 3 adenylate cyclase